MLYLRIPTIYNYDSTSYRSTPWSGYPRLMTTGIIQYSASGRSQVIIYLSPLPWSWGSRNGALKLHVLRDFAGFRLVFEEKVLSNERDNYSKYPITKVKGTLTTRWLSLQLCRCVCRWLGALKMEHMQAEWWPRCRGYSLHAPSQWETTLHCNVVSHCLGAYTIWSLKLGSHIYAEPTLGGQGDI